MAKEKEEETYEESVENFYVYNVRGDAYADSAMATLFGRVPYASESTICSEIILCSNQYKDIF